MVDIILASIDDAAASGHAADADKLAAVLVTLASASEARGFAISHRLAGRTDMALHWEAISDSYVREARAFGNKS